MSGRVFASAPPNRFREFIDRYYNECRSRAPGVEAIAGKWSFEDLIPGLSDFDTRLFVTDAFTDEDWCRMSDAVGEAHLALCSEVPEWARILEHLPGINVRWNEYTDPSTYYPEYRQWTIYRSDNPQATAHARDALEARPWSSADEYFFLKKFLTYYGPYDRAIDPAVNVGEFENKYPLHSRFMHYFVPPIQAAVSILEKRPIRGKLEALRLAAQRYPGTNAFDMAFEAVEKHYECPEWYEEPMLSTIENTLFGALQHARDSLVEELTVVDASEADTASWKRQLSRTELSPTLRFFDSTRFARLFKGRLRFYARAPKHFESIWCITNELRRAAQMFLLSPLKVYGEVFYKALEADTETAIARLVPDLASAAEADDLRSFASLTIDTPWKGREKEIALQIADVFDSVFRVLSRMGRRLLKAEG